MFRQSSIASFANAKIAASIIVDSIVADGSADSAHITNIVEVGYFLEIVFVTNRAIFL